MTICGHCANRLHIQGTISKNETCELCGGLLDQIGAYFNIFKEETKEIEFSSFLIGVEASKKLVEKDDQYRNDSCKDCASFKSQFNTLLGEEIEAVLNKVVDFKTPEVVFTVRQEYGDYTIWIKSFYIAGRYRKLRRGIPQSPWINTAKEHEGEKSVSEYIGLPTLDMLKGKDYRFFASGREDVDALMLGNGRPFYVEVIQPRKRSVDLGKMAETIQVMSKSGIEITELRIGEKQEIEQMKELNSDKLYEVGISLEESPTISLEALLPNFEGEIIRQRTPTRILGLRKNKLRERKIYSVKVKEKNANNFTLLIKTEAGTYVKEFITGDNGRTNPSLSEKLGVNIKIEYLNVLEVN